MPSDSLSFSATSQNFFSQRLRLHYVEWGSRDNPTIVLVHGIQDHCRTWDDMVARIGVYAEDYHIVAPDLRGHGAPASKQRQDEHRRRKESGEPREKGKKPEKEKTFWEKNWMYIVPISFLVSNALSAPPQKQKRG